MAPLKKPLFVPPPPATLDYFFTKADASSSSRAPKRRVKVGSSNSSSRMKHTPAEIIILDSDDDDAPAVHAKRKAQTESSSSSSDVEVVETEGTSSSSGKRFCARGLGTVDVDESLHFAEFGRPKLLLTPTEHSPGLPEDEPASRRHPRTVVLRHRRPVLINLSKLTKNGVQVTTSSFVRSLTTTCLN